MVGGDVLIPRNATARPCGGVLCALDVRGGVYPPPADGALTTEAVERPTARRKKKPAMADHSGLGGGVGCVRAAYAVARFAILATVARLQPKVTWTEV
jgi:hypothetical protein